MEIHFISNHCFNINFVFFYNNFQMEVMIAEEFLFCQYFNFKTYFKLIID
jgi:hypothetical protein